MLSRKFFIIGSLIVSANLISCAKSAKSGGNAPAAPADVPTQPTTEKVDTTATTVFEGRPTIIPNEQDSPSVKESDIPENTQLRRVGTSGALSEVPVFSREKSKTQEELITSDLTKVTCAPNIAVAVGTARDGLNLVAGSNVLLKRDLNYKFNDGSVAKTETKPFSLVTCEEAHSNLVDYNASVPANYKQKTLKVARSTRQTIIVSEKTDSTERVERSVNFSCADSIENSVKMTDEKNVGVVLQKGSMIVVTKSKVDKTGTRSAETSALVISCE